MSQSGCPLLEQHYNASSPWKPGDVTAAQVGSVSKVKRYPDFPNAWTSIHSTEDAAEHGDSHVGWAVPCDGPDNKARGFLFTHMNACKHAQHGHNINCTHGSTISYTHTHAEVELSREVNTK